MLPGCAPVRLRTVFCAFRRVENASLSTVPMNFRPMPRFYCRPSRTIPPNAISTLDAHKLSASDFIDCSGMRNVRIEARLAHPERQELQSTRSYMRVAFFDEARERRGFFYYHPAPNGSLGEVRFRITESGDPSAFQRGTDLVYPLDSPKHRGEVWAVSPRRIARCASHTLFRRLLLQDGLVSPGLLAMPKSFFRETGRQAISTLDPRKLRTSDFQDLSGQRRVQIPLVLPGFEPAYAQLYLANTVGGTPRGTHGFLYYDAGGGDAAQGTPGEVRFRVTESSDPASFPHGQDMPKYLSSFEPWSLPLTHIAHIRLHCALRVLLEKDGLVVSWQAVPNPASKRITISALGEPFRVKFGRTPPLTVKGAHSEASCCLVLIRPVPPIPPGVTRHPVVGSALCCFEQSQDANLLVIRVLKIIEPPRYSHPTYEGKISLPVEGDILRGPGGIPRTYPLNRRSKIAGTLRLLVPTQW